MMTWKDKFFFACMTLALIFVLLAPMVRDMMRDTPTEASFVTCYQVDAEKLDHWSWILTFHEKGHNGWYRKWSATNHGNYLYWFEYPSLKRIENRSKEKFLDEWLAKVRFCSETGKVLPDAQAVLNFVTPRGKE